MIEAEVFRRVLGHQLRHPGQRNAAVERAFDEERSHRLEARQAGSIGEHVRIGLAVK